MPPTTMLHRLPFPAQARPRFSRAAPVTRPRHVSRAAPANGGSRSSSVADRQEQAASASATERPPSSASSSPPPPSPPLPSTPVPPQAEHEQQRRQQPGASTSSSFSPSSSSQQNPSSNKALEAERPWRRCVVKRKKTTTGLLLDKAVLPLSLFLTKNSNSFSKHSTQAPPPGLFCLAALDLHALRKLACRWEGKRDSGRSRKRRE